MWKYTPIMLLSGLLLLTSFVGVGTEQAEADALSAKGREVYKQGTDQVRACAECHGMNGEGRSKAAYPRLAGLSAEHALKQMRDYLEGRRDNPIVLPILQGLTEDEMRAVADYIAELQAPNTVSPPPAEMDGELLKLGQRLAEQGNWNKELPACNACHGPGGRGVTPHFPPLAAQHPRYLIAQINAWKFGSRRNDPNHLMKAVAERLDDREIRAVAAYYGSLQP